ncbi:hypothetical protein CRI70_16250 [Streptomyces sp. Ru87]|nr:hypothetical protein CRI70_16250 [Streptomyces sp. Ru87]
MTIQQPLKVVMPRSYPPAFRRKVIDLVASGRKVAEVALLLGISDQTIYVWRRQHLIDTGISSLKPSNSTPPNSGQSGASIRPGAVHFRRMLQASTSYCGPRASV